MVVSEIKKIDIQLIKMNKSLEKEDFWEVVREFSSEERQ